MAEATRKVTFYARFDGSEVMNEIGTVDVDIHWERPVQKSDNPAPGAKNTIGLNIGSALIDLYEQIAEKGA